MSYPNRNPGGYLGNNARFIPNITTVDRAPTTTDNKNVKLMDEWNDTATGKWYKLLSLDAGVATWVLQLSGGGEAVDSFTVPFGTSPVVPDVSGNINLPAGNGFAFTGGTNAMTGNMVSPFTGDFTFTDSTSGNTESLIVQHTSNTSNSSAQLFLRTAGSSGGNPYIFFTATNVPDYAIGLKNGVSPTFNMATNADLTTGLFFSAASTGAITFANAYTFPIADGASGQALVTNGAGQLSFADISSVYAYTQVSTTPYVVLSTDDFLSVDTGTAKTIQLPNSTTVGRAVIVKDRTGTAAANNITVTTVGGVVNIDGATSYLITVNFGSASFLWNGTSYEVF